MSRYTAAAIAAAILFAAGLAGNTAFAQTLTLSAATNAQGHVVLTARRVGYTHPNDGTNVVQISRCEVETGMTTCDTSILQGARLVVSGAANHPGDTFTDEVVELGATYIYLWNDISATPAGGNVIDDVQITVAVGGGDAADNAVLPNVLRQQTRGIQRGIYNRILQRQREDGKWK